MTVNCPFVMGIHRWTDSPHSAAVFNIVYIVILNTLRINQSTCRDMWRNQKNFPQIDAELQTNAVASLCNETGGGGGGGGNQTQYVYKHWFGRWCIIKLMWHFWDYQLIVCRLNIMHSLPRLRVLKGLKCLNLYLFISLVCAFKWGNWIYNLYCSFHVRLR